MKKIVLLAICIILFLLFHWQQIFSVWSTNSLFAQMHNQFLVGDFLGAEKSLEAMRQGDNETIRNDIIDYNLGQIWFRSGATSPQPSPSRSSYLVTRRGSTDELISVYDVAGLELVDNGNETIKNSRTKAIEYFESSNGSGATHNVETIRILLEENRDEEQKEEKEEQNDEDSEQNDEGNEENAGDDQEGQDEGEGDRGDPGEQDGAGQDSEEQNTPQLPEQVKQQLEQYQEQIQRQQAQNQQFFNKQTPSQQPQDIFEAIFGQPQFRQQIGAGANERDW